MMDSINRGDFMRKVSLPYRLAGVILLALALFGVSFQAFAQDATAEATPDPNNPVAGHLVPLPTPASSGYAEVNDIKMYYAIYGDDNAEPLLLLHGGLANADYFANQIPAFVAAGYRVITPDSRGHGRSSVTATPIGYDLMSSDVLALLDFLKIDSTNLVGWSDGGIIGLDIAIHHPERLEKLIAYGANYNPGGVKSDVGGSVMFNTYGVQAEADYKRLSPTPDRFNAFLANITNMWATEPNFTKDEMRNISVPTLFIDGWQEEAIKPEHDFEMSQLVPNSELILMPEIGHFAMFLKPELFNSLVLNFLSQ
jgi:pimeloyl-ACP methyl ester carboxylesterase